MTWGEDTGSHTLEDAGRHARAHAEDDWPIEDHSAPTGEALTRLRAFEAALVAGAW